MPFAIAALRAEKDVVGTIAAGRGRGAQKAPFLASDVRLLKSIAETGGAAIHRSCLYHSLQESYIQMVLTLARALDARDSYADSHSERLAQ